MAYTKTARKGGQGGKVGHSNMSHYTTTHEVKKAAKKGRRVEDRKAADG